MANDKYGIIKPKAKFPFRKLLKVPHKGGSLIVSYPAFGAGTYQENIKLMSEEYFHPITGKKMTFVPATTSESISAAGWRFETLAKPQIFDQSWLQIGYIVRTQDGIFTNSQITDESSLKKMLNGAKKVNGIYLINDKMAFAPYESFKLGVQESGKFAEGGLARALENTEEKVAKNLKEISSSEFYERGVNVWGFESVKEPISRVVSLDSDWNLAGFDRLVVDGGDWYGSFNGYAFGVESVAD